MLPSEPPTLLLLLLPGCWRPLVDGTLSVDMGGSLLLSGPSPESRLWAFEIVIGDLMLEKMLS